MTKYAILAAQFLDFTPDGVNQHIDETLLIDDGRVVGFVSESELPDDAEVIDYGTKICLPGLIDTAFLPHLMMGEEGVRPNSLGLAVWHTQIACAAWRRLGVTTAATLGAAERFDLDLTKSIAAGRFPGPRIIPAWTPLAPAGSANFPHLYGVREVHGADDARRAARDLIKQGADRIVVYADPPLTFDTDPDTTSRHRVPFSIEELSEMVMQARQAGCYVHAQAISTQAIDHCIAAGVRSLGCAYGLRAEHIPQLADKGIAIAPNLALGATIRQFGADLGLPSSTINMVSAQRIAPELLQQAHAAGVEIIIGTNAAMLQGDVYRECLELSRAGLPNEAILRAATINAASALKPFVESGSFRPHHHADMIFTADNPLNNLEALATVDAVMIAGQLNPVMDGH